MLYINPIDTAQSLNRPGADPRAREQHALQELEHLFIFTLLTEMRRTTTTGGGLLEDSPSMSYFNEMMDDALSAAMARSGQFGIAKALAEQLRIQDMQTDLGLKEIKLAADI